MNQRLPYTAWAKKAQRALRETNEAGEQLFSIGVLVDSDEEGKAIFDDCDLERPQRGEPGTYAIIKTEDGRVVSECVIGGAAGARRRVGGADANASLGRAMSAQSDGWALLMSAHERALAARDKDNETLRKENRELRDENIKLKEEKAEQANLSPEMVIIEKVMQAFMAWQEKKANKDDLELLREFTEHLVPRLDEDGQRKALALLNDVKAGNIQ